MNGFNKVILMGNLTKDPEIRYTPAGTAVANFSLAVNRRYKQGGEVKDEVSYLDIVVFGKQADSCGQYLNKGDAVIIDGRLQQRRWETEDGQKRNKVEIVANSVQFMPKRQGSVSGGPAEDVTIDNSAGSAESMEDDTPF
ncbi:MAG: single-stranded DNA-binding protein [Nitrospirae bacterium GWA2_42_11]|nr:MAG: single-stranded DNA-binding protein [Nitrospirae bacterium GWA2_42_11]